MEVVEVVVVLVIGEAPAEEWECKGEKMLLEMANECRWRE
jgi:hypothetical protein